MQGNNSKIGQLIKNQLCSLGKNQSWLAAQCGVTRGQISHLIKGKSNPSLKLLESLSANLCIDSKALLEATFKN